MAVYLTKSDFKVARDCAAKLFLKKKRYQTTNDADPYMQMLAEGGYLVEEVGEYLDSGDVQELVDVAEVLQALADSHGLTAAELKALRTKKRKQRGGFDDGLYYSGDKLSGA